MGTKWKSRMGWGAWLLLFTIGLSGTLTFLSHWDAYLGKSYFDSDEFESEYNTFLGYLHISEVSNLTADEMKEKITVSNEEMEEYRFRYGDLSEQINNIQEQYRPQLEEARTENNEKLEGYYQKQRDKKIEDIQKNFDSDKYVKEKVKKEKEKQIDQFIENKQEVKRQFRQWNSSFDYYLQNNNSAEVFTNLTSGNKQDALQKMNNSSMLYIQEYNSTKDLSISDYMPPGDYTGEGPNYENTVAEVLSDENPVLIGKIGVPKALPKNSMIYEQYHMFKINQLFFYIYSALGVLGLVISIWLARKYRMLSVIGELPLRDFYKKVPIDLKGAALLLFIVILLVSIGNIFTFSMYGNYSVMMKNTLFDILFTTIIAGLILVQAVWLRSGIKENGLTSEDWKHTLVYRLWMDVLKAFHSLGFAFQIIVLLVIVFASGFGVGFIMYNNQLLSLYLILFIVVTVPALLLLLRKVSYFNRIVIHSSDLAAGKMEPDLVAKGHSPLAGLARNINTLKHGVKALQKSEAKSERLKTELITNVSHDLRTPLTSIISYTELLKTPNLDEDSQKAYVEIIDRKSKRLKVLIDDLFEASKMASGNIELVRTKADIVQMLQQALAENDEAIEKSNLQFRLAFSEQPILADVDGQKMWRVFDNLIGNALKYSLDHTRVYIGIEQMKDEVIITFKNITKYELGGNTDELFERFKRGDASRHTDGSGLGLAIAKSIVDLHEGRMDVEVDGDLFKVIIRLETV
ncbi:sensor histidine kinase [Fictibacillus fluitans]|uniref:histidine kinase n=1 Tax=Fictibacillus fluitans TaxID=3058422 RepID=A0ABT8I3F6_9BACL|nr:HAMP domain-containing sensor histidine kinase [Fictibacillus sp. NE201]MDN4527562.1 HAMP domain-containing sensor histidine kinase [Fictibacillus sp. NE201]